MKIAQLTEIVTQINKSVKSYDWERIYVATWTLEWSNINFEKSEKVDYENKPSRANQEVEVWDVIFAKMQNTKKTLLITEKETEFIFSSWFFVLRTNEEILSEYLYHFLNSSLFLDQKDRNCTWATQRALTLEWLQKIKIPLPSLTIQKQIIKKLDTLTELINLRKLSIEKTEKLTKSIFIEMFGDPMINEKGWEVKKLEEVVAKDKIVTYWIVQAWPHVEDGVPYIKSWDIKNNQIINISLLSRTSYEIANSYKRSQVNYGDVIMSIRASVWMVAILPKELDWWNLTQWTARISPWEFTNKYFLFYLILSNGIQRWLDKNTKWATFKEITLWKLREMPIILPPISLQNKFASIVEKNEENIKKQKESLKKLEELYASVMQESFRV